MAVVDSQATVLVEVPTALWEELSEAAHSEALADDERVFVLASLAAELGLAATRVDRPV